MHHLIEHYARSLELLIEIAARGGGSQNLRAVRAPGNMHSSMHQELVDRKSAAILVESPQV